MKIYALIENIDEDGSVVGISLTRKGAQHLKTYIVKKEGCDKDEIEIRLWKTDVWFDEPKKAK